VLKSYKYRIYPTVVQKQKIEQTFNICRLVYNLALQVKIETYKSNKTNLSAFDLDYQLTDMKKEFTWMNEVDSQALQASIKKMDIAFKGFFNGKGYPKYKSKRGKQSFQCPNNTRKIDWYKNTLTIPKIKDIPIVLNRNFSGKIKTVTITRVPSGKYFASILVETNDIEVIKPQVTPEKSIGIDVGIKAFVITSDGKSFESNRFLKNSLKRLQCLQRRSNQKKKGSNNRKKANRRIVLIHEKITNQRIDYIHKITTSLVKGDNQTFFIEDLNVSGMLKNRKLSQAISDVSFGEFFRQMKYKCDWYGKNLIQIGRFEPTSKTCSLCGEINEMLTLNDREWVCAGCGILHDRDINAAKNIKKIGLEKYSGEGIPGEPVEKCRLRRSKKQEDIAV